MDSGTDGARSRYSIVASIPIGWVCVCSQLGPPSPAVSVGRAFDFYADAVNLEPMTPPWLHFRVTTPGPIAMGAGTLLDYRLRLRGFPVRWQTRIETWEPPLRFTDIQARGPYSLWEHTHVFEPDGDRACTIHDRVRYAIPYGPLGILAHRLFVRRDLERIFNFRRDAFTAHFSAD